MQKEGNFPDKQRNQPTQKNWDYFDKRLFAIQKSTRPSTKSAFIQKITEKLRIKFRWYYYWKIDPIYLYDDPDQQIYAIQKSTRTNFKFIQPLHEWLRQRNRWYYKWHIRPQSNQVHLSALALYFCATSLFLGLALIAPSTKLPKANIDFAPDQAEKNIDYSKIYASVKPDAKEIPSKRSENTKVFRNTDGTEQYIVSGGPLHYKDGDKWCNIDSSIRPNKDNTGFTMDKSIYKANFGKNFLTDPLVNIVKDGQNLTVRPKELQFSTPTNNQLISNPNNSDGTSNNKTLTYKDAYGPGLDFAYETNDFELQKKLNILTLASLPTPTIGAEDKADLSLKLNLDYTVGDGLDIYINDKIWDGSEITTENQNIVFKKADKVVWQLTPATAWDNSSPQGRTISSSSSVEKPTTSYVIPAKAGIQDSSNQSANIITGKTTLTKTGNKISAAITFPYTWLKTAQYPVTIDPNFNGSSNDMFLIGDDGWAGVYSEAHDPVTLSYNDVNNLILGQQSNSEANFLVNRVYLEFDTSSITDTDTVNYADLHLKPIFDASDTDFNIRINQQNWTYGSGYETNWANTMTSDYDNLWQNTADIAADSYSTSSSLDTTWIKKDAATKYSLISDHDLSTTSPGANEEYIGFYSQEDGVGYQPYLSIVTTPAAAPGISISGSCKAYDESTNCTDSETVKVAVNGSLAAETTTTSSGAFTIANVAVNSGDVVTVFVDGVIDAKEANAVTIYDGTGDIAGVLLYEDHLTIGSDDNQTITNANLASYDYSVSSSDEDIFFDVDANNDLSTDATNQTAQDKIYVKASNTYRPDSGGSGNVSTTNFYVAGTVTADANTFNAAGNWDASVGTFTRDTSTVNLTGTGTLSASNNSAFYDLNCAYTGKTTTLSNTFPIRHRITLQGDSTGSLTGSYTNLQFYSSVAAGFIASNGATMVGTTGIILYGNASPVMVLPTGTFYNSINLYSNEATGSANYELGGNISIRGMFYIYGNTASKSSVFDLKGYNISTRTDSTWLAGIELGYNGDTSRYGQIINTSQATNSTLSLDSNITIYSGAGNSKIDGSGTGGAPKTININIKGNWVNGDTYTPGAGTVDFQNTATKTLTSGGTGAGKLFNNIIHSGAGILQLATNNLDIDGNFTNSGGTFDTNSLDMTVAGDWTNSNTFTSGTRTVTFDGTAPGKKINPGASSFYNLTFNGSGGEWSPLTNTVTVTNDLTMTAGTFNTSQGTADVTVNGTVAGTAGIINMTSTNTFTQRVGAAKNFGNTSGSSDWTFFNLNFENSGAAGYTITTATGSSGKIVVSNTLTIGKATDSYATTLDNETNDRTIDANGDVTITSKGVLAASTTANFTVVGTWTNSGTFTAGSGTVTFDGTASGKTINTGGVGVGKNFYNLTFNGTGGIWTLLTSTMTVGGNLTITAGTFDPAGLALTVTGMFSNSGNFGIASPVPSGAHVFNGSSAWLIYSGATYYLSSNATATYITAPSIDCEGTLNATSNRGITFSAAASVDFTNGNFVKGTGTMLFSNNSNSTVTFIPGTTTTNFGAMAVYASTNAGTPRTTLTISTNDLVATSMSVGQFPGSNRYGTLNITNRTLTLTGTGTPLTISYVAGTAQGAITTTGSTIVYAGSNVATTVANFQTGQGAYNNVAFTPNPSVATTYNLAGAQSGSFAIAGTFTINTNATFDPKTYDFSVTGAFTNNGNFGITGTKPSGVHVFSNTFTNNTGATFFATTGTSTTITGVMTNAGTITATSGAISAAANWTSNAGTFTPGGTTVTLTGNSSNINGTSATQTFYNLTINKTANQTVTVNGSTNTLNITNIFTQTQGNFIAPAAMAVTGNFSKAAGTFTAGANLSVGGTFANASTFTHSSGTVTFNRTSSGGTINSGSQSFYNVIFNGAGGAWSALTNTMTVAGDLTMTAGTLNTATGTADITVNGNVKCGASTCGTIDMTTSGTNLFTQSVSGPKNFGTSVNADTTHWKFYNLTFSSGDFTITTSTAATGDITVNNILTIASGTILNAGNRIWHLSGNGTPFVKTGDFTPATSTFSYDGTAAQIISGATSWYNLTINNTYADPDDTYDVDPSAAQTISNTFTITHGQYSPVTGDSYKNVSIADAAHAILKPDSAAATTVNGNWTKGALGVFTANSGTVTFNGTAGQTLVGDTTFYNLTIDTNANGANQINFTNASKQTITNTWTLDGASGKVLTLRSTVADSAWKFDISANFTAGDYINVMDSQTDTSYRITPGANTTNAGNNDPGWVFNQPPTNNSLTFTNPYSGTTNTAVSDDTTEWNFEVKVTDPDGPTDIDNVYLNLANNFDSSANPTFDSIKLKWTRTANPQFTKEADTQNAITLTSVNGDAGSSGNQWTLNFKIKINDGFTNFDTLYAGQVLTTDKATTVTNNSSNLYQVANLFLDFNIDQPSLSFGSLLPGSIITDTTTTTISTNYPAGYSLSISDNATGGNSTLLHTDAATRIADYLGTILNPTSWSGSGLGFCVYTATDKDTTKWGTGTTATDSNNKYAGVPQNATVISTKSGAPTVSDETNIGYKLVVENTQKTGDYAGNITFTVTGLLN